jgi:UDP-GlcNAc:undecaprenyl-phosphate GlcNAc-1-phosphate transferase
LGPITGILVGTLLVFGIGFLDDVRPLPVWPRVLVQVLAALVVMSSGLLIERLTIGGMTWHLGPFAWLLTMMWIVGLTNAFNLIDGIDGLAAGIAVIAGATCTAILVLRGHAAEAMLLSALVGAALGFLVYNFAPASIFLGDGGSLAFGFVLATTAITGWQKGATALAAGVPLLIFALPLADLSSALVRRVFRRHGSGRVTITSILRQIVEPDREHIHHRLAALGWSTRRTVLLLYAVTLLFSALALATARFD